ncbi:MAG TPA: tetratricopeptide repeat-containing sensor histidine kinase [Puia sp.]|nr:tetratricopeptide repeat-containing sensor histidine kinase [Puia sp.]
MKYTIFTLLMAVASPILAQPPIDIHAADSNIVSFYIDASRTFEQTQPDSAVYYCYRGLRIAEKQNDLQAQGLILLQVGHINNIHHHTDLARRFTNEALSIFRNLRDKKNIARAYNELALLDGQGNLSAATADLDRSMQFYADMRDTTGIAATYQNMGTVYEEKGELEKALTYYLRALVHYEHHAQKTDEYFILLQRISRIYSQKGDRQAALRYLEEGIRNSKDPVSRDTEITLLEEEGQIMETAGENANALLYFKKELDAARQDNDLEGEAKALTNIAGVLKKDSAARSLEYLKKALGIAERLREAQLKANIYQALADVYRQKKNYKEALLALEEHSRLLDSLMIIKTNSDISALDTSYQLESSREAIDELQEVNEQGRRERNLGIVILVIVLTALTFVWIYLRKVQRLNRKLYESNQVRDKLFSIIGHDLKGPAGNTVQLLEIMETGTLPPDQVKKLFSELKKQSVASFDLLTALFEWGKAQLDGVEVKAEDFKTKPFIQKNIQLLHQLAERKSITLTDQTPGGISIHADPNHFDFIVRNLLSNAIKFTHEHGRVEIDVTATGNEITFSVKDTGIGISEEKQAAFQKTNIPVSFGTKGEKGSGLGLLLIKEFIQANKGRIRLDSRPGEGSIFYISFPAAAGPQS